MVWKVWGFPPCVPVVALGMRGFSLTGNGCPLVDEHLPVTQIDAYQTLGCDRALHL